MVVWGRISGESTQVRRCVLILSADNYQRGTAVVELETLFSTMKIGTWGLLLPMTTAPVVSY